MPSDQLFDVAVIGAGASGALLAAQYRRQASPGARLALLGSGKRPARGVAYETPFLANLLNVPAGNMSAFPDDREHFVHWLAARLPGSGSGTFAPRSIYGEYLDGILAETLAGDTVELVAATVLDVTRHGDFWTVHLHSGGTIRAKAVVLAIGNALAPADPLDMSRIAPWCRGNPWAEDAVPGVPTDAPVLMIGTGLTMVDTALSLRESGHRGPIHAVSRHGKLYQQHAPYAPQPLAKLPGEFRTPCGGLRWVRNEIERQASAGGDWRAVIDSLRPYTAKIWGGWSLRQRGSFLRHARNQWDVHRHRMAPKIAEQLSRLLSEGALTIHAGRLLGADSGMAGARVTVRSTQNGALFDLDVVRVINCTGPARNYSTTDIPPIARLREQGLLTPDRLRLGFESDLDGRIIGSDGSVNSTFYTIGPLRIPTLFESIAIPEIRVQAEALAGLLAAG
jgi:uncharacterized NAD(P)/FAD-binding protein YdhS